MATRSQSRRSSTRSSPSEALEESSPSSSSQQRSSDDSEEVETMELSEHAEVVLKTRTEEKEEFASLNQRLDYLLYCHRERLARQINEREAEKEQSSVRNLAKQTGHQVEITALQARHKKALTRIAELEGTVEGLRSDGGSSPAAKRKSTRGRHRSSAASESDDAEEEEEEDEEEEDEGDTTEAALRHQVSELKRRLLALSDEDSMAVDSDDDDASGKVGLVARLQEKNDLLQSEVHRLRIRSGESSSVHPSLGTGDPEVWERALKEQQMKSEADKRQCMDQQRAVYMEKLAAYRTALGKFGHQVEIERTKQTALQNKNAKLQYELNAIRKSGRGFKVDEVGQLRQQLLEKNAIIREMRAAFHRKDEEFDALMDIKIALDVELESIETLLNDEERRLGWASTKPSKRGAVGLAHHLRHKLGQLFHQEEGTTGQEEEAEDGEEEEAAEETPVRRIRGGRKRRHAEEEEEGTRHPARSRRGTKKRRAAEDAILLSFVSADVNGRSFHIQNQSSDAHVNLSDFYVRTRASNLRLELIDEELAPGQVCVIFTLNQDRLHIVQEEARKAKQAGNKVSFWKLSSEELLAPGSDFETITLYDKAHNEVYGTVDIFSDFPAAVPEETDAAMDKDVEHLTELLNSPEAESMSGEELLDAYNEKSGQSCVVM